MEFLQEWTETMTSISEPPLRCQIDADKWSKISQGMFYFFPFQSHRPLIVAVELAHPRVKEQFMWLLVNVHCVKKGRTKYSKQVYRYGTTAASTSIARIFEDPQTFLRNFIQNLPNKDNFICTRCRRRITKMFCEAQQICFGFAYK